MPAGKSYEAFAVSVSNETTNLSSSQELGLLPGSCEFNGGNYLNKTSRRFSLSDFVESSNLRDGAFNR